jgi:hypothetical protein
MFSLAVCDTYSGDFGTAVANVFEIHEFPVARSTAGCDETKRGWNSVEGNEIIANADYLRQVMVRFLSQQSDEDREMGKTFSKPLGGDFQNWNPVAAANYLEALRKKLIPGPPT